ncbi:MAG TPA: YSC84-related protein [Burkholderiales bacterium]|nr:YSC84-related protein [Burkholderiales bacterium]
MLKRTFLAALTLAFALLPYSMAVQAKDNEKKKSPEQLRAELKANVQSTIARFKKTDPGVERFLKDSAGYAVFPTIGKLGFILGGGYGEGEVYEAGKLVGVASLSFGTVGLQAGAQEYGEIVFFKEKADVERFKQNKFEFDASASAVVWKSGAAAANDYRGGVAVFVLPKGGVMAEAAIGGQRFAYKPEAK